MSPEMDGHTYVNKFFLDYNNLLVGRKIERGKEAVLASWNQWFYCKGYETVFYFSYS